MTTTPATANGVPVGDSVIDPRWDMAYLNAWVSLTEAWEYRLVVSGIIASVCTVFGMSERLVYCMFATLTADMVLRFVVLVKLHVINNHIQICVGLKRGMPRYIQYCTFIVMAWAAQLSINQAVGINLPVIDCMMAYLVFQDLSSITGSLHALGWRIPGILEKVIRRGRRQIDRRIDEHFPDERNQEFSPETEAREPYTPAEHPNRRASDRGRVNDMRYGEHNGQAHIDPAMLKQETPDKPVQKPE